MRPKLRDDCFFAPVDDGVLLSTSSGTARLKGRTVFTLLDRLAPYLDGRRTLDALVSGLPADQREVVAGLVRMLEQSGMVRDLENDLPHGLSARELETYAQEIGFLDLLGGSGGHRFERFRRQRILVVGAGLVVTELINLLWRLGLRQPTALLTPETATDRDRMAEDLRQARERDQDYGLTEVADPGDWAAEGIGSAVLRDVDMVVHCGDRPMLGRAAALNRAAVGAGVAILQAQVVGGHAWVGAVRTGNHGGCWECGWRWLSGGLSADDPAFDAHLLRDRPDAEPEPDLSGPMCTLVAGSLAFAAFTMFARPDADGRASSFSRIDLATGVASTHEFQPHPLCAACVTPAPPAETDFRVGLSELRARPATTADAFSEAAVRLIEPQLGAVRSLDEGGQRQFPLKVAVARVADPTACGSGVETVVRAGGDHTVARRRAAVAAVEAIAARLVDRRRLVPGPAGPGAWAWDAQTEAVELVPAELLFAVGGDGPPRAVAGGASWPEAVGRALLWHCHRLTASERCDGGGARRLDAAEFLGAESRHLLAVVAGDGPVVGLHDVTGPLGVPTVAISTAAATVASASAFDLVTAARIAMDGAILVRQGVRTPPTIPAAMENTEWAAELPHLVKRLGAAGWRILVTPLDHDPVLATVLPCLVATALVAGPDGGTPS